MTYAAQRGAPTPAIATRRPEQRHTRGVAWVDDDAWIRSENWREAPRDPTALPAAVRWRCVHEAQIAVKATLSGLATTGLRDPIRAFCNGPLLSRLPDIPDDPGVYDLPKRDCRHRQRPTIAHWDCFHLFGWIMQCYAFRD